jgi:hypothetical protein
MGTVSIVAIMPLRSTESEAGNTGPSREIDTAQNAPSKLFSARKILVGIARLELHAECKNDHCISGRRIITDNQNQPSKIQSILEPRNTLNTRKSGRQKPRLLFRVFRVFGGKESDPSDSRTNRLWNHGTHLTRGIQDVRSLGCFSVYSVVNNPIPVVQEGTDFGTTEHTEHTEFRTSGTSTAFPCVPCIPWLNRIGRTQVTARRAI